MSTDRSKDPFPSFAAAADAVLDAPSELAHRLLTSLLQAEERAERARLRAERAEAEASTDVLTGACSRRYWEQVLDGEERRCARYGHHACVVSVDLDELKSVNDAGGHGAGDALLRATARALGTVTRATDVVARVGGDEFAVLAVDTDLVTGRVLVGRIAEALRAAGVSASVGLAERDPEAGLDAAWAEADHRMYAAKRRRHAAAAAAAV
ncbi:MAG: diguanylate cyclase/phosphodiesterase (GGDEF & EAL domains) with PAS/PAC sensor(s) [uncultured Solirubrobacteraceae bacterium]|uniref:Diguanylate cyclase/phosphodiesterase (GGDEF & EAL domains) with PAS/PAC sensor(S) n=1 Tax=uncultured Solirubrobacteraceae bacterium TaxID=1162706 RepID=A0A6J4SX84_9ACTN|nr:MAG: diguanylate cyclase/phosphodiesterase (GGDEF & EAL domains) with PAS/PAC sensor(s) [uncultured Solirubrobacteraceae bacterium]